MKSMVVCWPLLFCLLARQAWAQSGIRGDYYVGTNFEEKAFSRIDPAISFNWDRRSPGKGLSRSYYSIRWTGKLLAPVTGEYKFFAKVNDGIRVWVGNRKVLDSWQLNSYKHYSGNIILEAGHYYDLRVDYFNAIEWGEIVLYWKPPPAAKSARNPFAESGEPITAEHFFQKAPPITVVPKPTSSAVTRLPTVPTKTPKPALSLKPKTAETNPILNPPSPKKTRSGGGTGSEMTSFGKVSSLSQYPHQTRKTIADDTLAVADIKPGVTLILPTIQFEQSSYVLLPESSTELNKLVQVMKANSQWHVHIAGHTDNVGDPRLNLALSEQRAKVVATYLTRQGIADERITTEGFGSRQPITGNSTEGERSQNRRVEITIR